MNEGATRQSSVVIRQAGPADADELARLRWDFTFEEDPVPTETPAAFARRFAATWRQYHGSGRWTVWVAEDRLSHGLIGCIWVERVDKVPRPIPHADHMGYVTNVYVEPRQRNRGVGTALLRAAVDHASERDWQQLFLWPSDASAAFYARAGFRPSNEVLERSVAPSHG
jgi:RimJ/RimL family protein N-acetyltransferase